MWAFHRKNKEPHSLSVCHLVVAGSGIGIDYNGRSHIFPHPDLAGIVPRPGSHKSVFERAFPCLHRFLQRSSYALECTDYRQQRNGHLSRIFTAESG